MMDFNEIALASKNERIRAWCIEQAMNTDQPVIAAAAQIEKFILLGETDASK